MFSHCIQLSHIQYGCGWPALTDSESCFVSVWGNFSKLQAGRDRMQIWRNDWGHLLGRFSYDVVFHQQRSIDSDCISNGATIESENCQICDFIDLDYWCGIINSICSISRLSRATVEKLSWDILCWKSWNPFTLLAHPSDCFDVDSFCCFDHLLHNHLLETPKAWTKVEKTSAAAEPNIEKSAAAKLQKEIRNDFIHRRRIIPSSSDSLFDICINPI